TIGYGSWPGSRRRPRAARSIARAGPFWADDSQARRCSCPAAAEIRLPSVSWLGLVGHRRDVLADRLNINVDLLPNENGQVHVFEVVDHLQHPRINAFSGVARERYLRNDIKFEAHEFQRRMDRLIAAQIPNGRSVRADPPGVVF